MTQTLRALTPHDAAAAAALHALSFADPWSEAAFAAQLAAPSAVSLACFEDGALVSFALFQLAAGEAELLTLATLPARRGTGLARHLLTALSGGLQQRGVVRLTLDVADDNAPARHLYSRLGFTEDGRRPRYYAAGRLAPVDAILMSKPLAG